MGVNALAMNPDSFPDFETRFLLQGEAGAIECLAHAPAPEHTRAGVALICHPHPLHGGTMGNKVVSTTERALRELGLRTVRFNFRGVGLSEGEHDHGDGEVRDVLRVADWLAHTRPQDELWLAGFSFGAYVSLRAAEHLDAAQVISIAPAVTRFAHHDFPLPTKNWLVVMGEQDEVIEPRAVFDWIAALEFQPEVLRFPQAGHFFHGLLLPLRERMQAALQAHLPALIAP